MATTASEVVTGLTARGADVDALCALAASSPDRLHETLKALGYAKLGARHRIAQVLLQQPPTTSAPTTAAAPPRQREEAPRQPEPRQPSPSAARAADVALGMVSACEKRTRPPSFAVLPEARPPPRCVYLPIAREYPGLVRVHEAPPVYIIVGFASDAECDELVRLADPLLLRSKTDGGVSRERTSRSCHLRKETGACPRLLRKVHELTGKPASHMEDPQIAKYERGQFYTEHYDSAPKAGNKGGARPFVDEGGNRLCTVLVYLNDVPAGGGTRFSMLGLHVSPRKGCALVFFPSYLDDGEVDLLALHEALPATHTKYVCQIWVREREPPPADGAEKARLGARLLDALYSSGST